MPPKIGKSFRHEASIQDSDTMRLPAEHAARDHHHADLEQAVGREPQPRSSGVGAVLAGEPLMIRDAERLEQGRARRTPGAGCWCPTR